MDKLHYILKRTYDLMLDESSTFCAMVTISKCFANSEFHMFESNFGFGTFEQTIESLQTWSQH